MPAWTGSCPVNALKRSCNLFVVREPLTNILKSTVLPLFKNDFSMRYVLFAFFWFAPLEIMSKSGIKKEVVTG